MKLEYTVKGVTLDVRDIVKIHEFYRKFCIIEYLLEGYSDVVKTEEDARNIAADVLHLMDNHDYLEQEAIITAISKYYNISEKEIG